MHRKQPPSQFAEKLISANSPRRVSGHEFSRADKTNGMNGAAQLAEDSDFGVFCNKGTTLVVPIKPIE
jgi:hypothetical protein